MSEPVDTEQERWGAEQDEQERLRTLEERTAEALDGLYRDLRECLDVAAEPEAHRLMARALVDGLLLAEHGRCQPWQPFPFEGAGALNIEYLMGSAEHFLADIRTAVAIMRSRGPGPSGHRHGVLASAEGRCLCGWESTAEDRTTVARHMRAVIELGGRP